MKKAIIARKVGMMQMFREDGTMIPNSVAGRTMLCCSG